MNETGNPEKARELVNSAENIFLKTALDRCFYSKYVCLLTGLPNSKKFMNEILSSATFQKKLYYKSIFFIKQTEIAWQQKKFSSAFFNGICSLIIWPPNVFIYLKVRRI
jgi:hypothetical protein